MKTLIAKSAATALFMGIASPSSFLDDQKRFDRVKNAIENKEHLIEYELNKHYQSLNSFKLLMIAYKDIGELEVYAKGEGKSNYCFMNTYKICSSSGELGPKRRKGDYQVPEGFYYINRFNPVSSYHISLGLDYPNNSDRIKSKYSNRGGDIFIHGSCVTIGCLPMTDEIMEEIYLYAIHAKNNGQAKIPVYIFPFKMTSDNMKNYSQEYQGNKELIDFWLNLKQGYDQFSKNRNELSFSIAENGDYQFVY